MSKTIACFLFFCLGWTAVSASSKKQVIESEINHIYVAFESQQYAESLSSLHVIFTLDTIIPDETAFLLGVAFSHLNRPKDGQRALLKYISLTKDQGDYFRDCIDELYAVNKELGVQDKTDEMICDILGPHDEKVTCPECEGEKAAVDECTRCNGSKQEMCPVCRGQGVIVRFSYYNEYSECYECFGKGYVDCEKCHGEGVEKQECRRCTGHGEINKPRECDYFSGNEAPEEILVEEIEEEEAIDEDVVEEEEEETGQ